GTEVNVTLFADGEKAKEVSTAFSLANYDGIGGGLDGANDSGDDDDSDNGNNGSGKGDDDPKKGNDDSENGDGTSIKDDNGPGNGNNDSDNKNDDSAGEITTDNNNHGAYLNNGSETLPKTGTFFGKWFFQLLGVLMLLSGGFFVYRSRKVRA